MNYHKNDCVSLAYLHSVALLQGWEILVIEGTFEKTPTTFTGYRIEQIQLKTLIITADITIYRTVITVSYQSRFPKVLTHGMLEEIFETGTVKEIENNYYGQL